VRRRAAGSGSRRAAWVVATAVVALAVAVPAAYGAIALPDGRQWELVSPPSKNGALVEAMQKEGGIAQAAAGGGAFTWAASAPIDAQPAGSRSPELAQVFSARGGDGWSSRDITPPNASDTEGIVGGELSEYAYFSSDLSLGLVEPKGDTPLSPEASEKTIYLRDTASDSYVPLVTAANVQTGVRFGGEGAKTIGEIKFEGASADLNHIVLHSKFALTPNAAPESSGDENLYEWAGGRLRLVSVLPEDEGGVAATKPFLGDEGSHVVRRAVSSDGSRVIWSDEVSGYRLYMRDTGKEETVRLDVAQGAPQPSKADAQFQTASADDNTVFFSDGEPLTADSTALPAGLEPAEPDLYAFEPTNAEDESLKGTLTDLTVDTNAGEGADVQGLLPGVSEDGSYAYVVAKGVLTGAENAEREKAEAGADNLYMLHKTGPAWKECTNTTCTEWRDAFTTTFIARLSGEDSNDWAPNGGSQFELEHLTSHVSPNGRWLAFMSDRELTGYDNHDANSGAADEEVFLYHAPEDLGTQPGALACASCDPSGARPVGVFDTGTSEAFHTSYLLVDEPEIWKGRWLAANVPGWTPENRGKAFYQSRYLSNGGRLFFNSDDALVREDDNGTEDVYEYEPLGVLGCDGAEAASGSVTFRSAHAVAVEGGQGEEPAGCVGLISSGFSAEESVFLDAGENGGDVFFATAAKLAPQAYETSLAVYDAHECTASSPCIAPPAEASPPCATPEACRAPSVPQPAIFGAPPSQTFSGAGNASPTPAASVPKAKPPTRAQELAKALGACKKQPRKKRPACKRSARTRYGPKKPKHAAKKRGR
jgi:hypothetical protein